MLKQNSRRLRRLNDNPKWDCREGLGNFPASSKLWEWQSTSIACELEGIITNTTKQRLEELEELKSDLEIKILQTELQATIITEEQIVYWISRFKGGNVADMAYQRSIIDIFVSAIYIYDDRIVLTYNFKGESQAISLTDIECSDLPQSAPEKETNENQPQWLFVGETIAVVFPLEQLGDL